MSDLKSSGVSFSELTFSSLADIAELRESIVINCSGLGAKEICNDEKVIPIKGQLVRLPPQPELEYLYCGHGYIFPRADGVIVGGTFEKIFEHSDPVEAQCFKLLEYAKSGFLGDGTALRGGGIHTSEFYQYDRV